MPLERWGGEARRPEEMDSGIYLKVLRRIKLEAKPARKPCKGINKTV